MISLPKMSSDWRQQHVDVISDSLHEFITDGGAEAAHEALCDAIMSWIDYHQKELNEWRYLAARLNLPLPDASIPSSEESSKPKP
jgi:hypothetical protein